MAQCIRALAALLEDSDLISLSLSPPCGGRRGRGEMYQLILRTLKKIRFIDNA